jgi:ElaB/YqjD/DUF883 family membrane-anchored ribosome-binding protein
MELYYKDLISEESSLEKLVDNLMLVVQGASELAQAAGDQMAPEKNHEIRTKLERLQETCLKLKQQAMASARATDKLLREYPYSSLTAAFGLGFLAAALICRRR